jgi:WS/DGAT C-terminal domain/Wax ester synthase-like Acyl-CoA acyltransferase domain
MVAPRTSFNRRVSAHRRFVFGQLGLDEIKGVKNEFGCTVKMWWCRSALARFAAGCSRTPTTSSPCASPCGLLACGETDLPPGDGRPGRATWNLFISNVPGPPVPLYCAGARLVANYPVSVITDGMGLNITVMSHCGRMDFRIIADRDQMPDVNKLMGWLGEALEELGTHATTK